MSRCTVQNTQPKKKNPKKLLQELFLLNPNTAERFFEKWE